MSQTSALLPSFLRRARKIGVPADVKAKFLELAGARRIYTVNGNSARAGSDVAWFTNPDELSKEGLHAHYSLDRKCGCDQTDNGPVWFTLWTITKEVSLDEDVVLLSVRA
jgi:hypothetical protein